MLARVSEKAWLRVYREEARHEQNGRCAYCHSIISRSATTADHVTARIKGGQTRKENIKAACKPCNLTKGSMGEAAFLRAIKNPQPGDSIFIWLAWSRRRIGLAAERACNRIMRAAA
jgi:5-methylcytosine-specific restriction endonuclease McrA